MRVFFIRCGGTTPEHPDIIRQMSKPLDEYIANGRSTPGAKQANDAAIVVKKGNIKVLND